MLKFSGKADQFYRRCEPNCGKMSYLTMFEEFFNKTFLDPDREVNDFQNLVPRIACR